MSFLDEIKKTAIEAVTVANPVNLIFAEVTSASPLSVQVDQRFVLDADFLIVPESMTPLEITLEHSHATGDGDTGTALNTPVVIRQGLQQGDRVILLRMQGGQQYLVIDKVVTG